MRAFIVIIAILSLLVFPDEFKSQQFSQGIQINMPIASMMHFDQNYYLPNNYYYVLMVNSPDASLQRQNWFNVLQAFGRRSKNLGGGVGYMMKFSFSRFSLKFGYRFKYNNSIIKLQHYAGSSLGDDVVNDRMAVFYTQLFQHQYPIMLTMNLKRENDAPYILVGAEPGYIFGKIESEDWSESVFTELLDVPFLYGHLYNNKPYLSLNAGYGFRRKQFEFDFVLKYRIDQGSKQLSMHEYLLDFNLTYFFKGISINKKPFIYSDED